MRVEDESFVEDLDAWRMLLVGFLAMGGCAWGVLIGWPLPLLGAFGIFVAFLLERLRLPLELFPACLLLLGYVIGNRGFAQLNLLGFYVGELTMVALALALIWRTFRQQSWPFRMDGLGLFLLAFFALSLLRLPADLQKHGVHALRDFATVYYVFFFFVGMFLGRTTFVRGVLLLCFGAAIVVTIPAYLLFRQDPMAVISWARIGHIPVIYYKGDLVAAFLGAGVFLFAWAWFYRERWRLLALVLALLSLGLLVYSLSRAALVGFLLGSFWLVLGKQYKFCKILAGGALAGAVLLTFVAVQRGGDLSGTRFQDLQEHLVSFVDVRGERVYRGSESAGTGDNNRYRLVWWETLLRETWERSPWIGLGFGEDLARPFELVYYVGHGRHVESRSPHSFPVTLVARLGLFGLASFGVLLAFLVLQTASAARFARRDASVSSSCEPLYLWAMVWVLFGSSWFGVVLEGPMGAVVFWLFVGLANAATAEVKNSPTILENSKA